MTGTEAYRWLNPPDSPWPVPVLDVRSLTLTVTAWSKDAAAAQNAISFSGEDGLAFVDQQPPDRRIVSSNLQYSVDPILADGALFVPSAMEQKWALFCHQGRMIFVRTWTRRVALTATIHRSNTSIELTELHGAVTDPSEDPRFTEAAVDFIIRSHALREMQPAPLPADPHGELHAAAGIAFSLFGNFAHFATHHRFSLPQPHRPLRSQSLFHIAIARGDLAAAQAQLDLGIPVDLRAGDGLTAMHWAMASTNPEVRPWLLSRGLSIDARSDEGATALMNAVQDGSTNSVDWFLAHGADPNAADRRGFTSLHRAAEMGNAAIVQILLRHGARPEAEAERGYTPLGLAEKRGHRDVVALLTSR